uniref:cDNA FLJ58419, moderately similar to Tuftelin n=1 Tax=Homo sapiens TaxID=9606 RepID=B7Z5P6_HUMAN|nr:unnamed protein product [Homo sapiens]
MNGTRNWCTLVDVHPEDQAAAGRKTYAMVSSHSAGHSLASELVESHDGHEEIIKVYLKGRSGDKMIHEKNINQLKSEVQYIQEARNCLQKLREDISSKLDRNLGDSLHRQEIQVVLEKPNGFSQSPSALKAGDTDVQSDWRMSWGNEVPSTNTAQFLATNCLFFYLLHLQPTLPWPPADR